MAKHEITIHENTGATKTSAPYLGTYVTKAQVKTSEAGAALSAKCGLPAIQIRAALDGAFDAIEELEKETLCRVHTDLGTICGVITGSFASSDAAFDPAKNSLDLTLRLDDEIRLDLVDETPAIATDETVTKVRVDNVMDATVQKPYNVIHGQHLFRVAGSHMTMSDTGAGVVLTDAMGVTYPCTVDDGTSDQLVKAHSTSLLEPGDYKLVVKSKGGDAEGPLQTAFRRVKYLKIVDPVPSITGVVSQDGVSGVIARYAGTVKVNGANLKMLTGDTLTLVGQDSQTSEPLSLTFSTVSSTDAQITVTITNEEGSTVMPHFAGGEGITKLVLVSRGGVEGAPAKTTEFPVLVQGS